VGRGKGYDRLLKEIQREGKKFRKTKKTLEQIRKKEGYPRAEKGEGTWAYLQLGEIESIGGRTPVVLGEKGKRMKGRARMKGTGKIINSGRKRKSSKPVSLEKKVEHETESESGDMF